VYRGIDDYQHSWIADLIIRFVAGLEISPYGKVELQPFDFGLGELELTNVRIRGKRYSVFLKNGKFQLVKGK